MSHKPKRAAMHWMEISNLARIVRPLRSQKPWSSSMNAAGPLQHPVLTATAQLVMVLIMISDTSLLSGKAASRGEQPAKHRHAINSLPIQHHHPKLFSSPAESLTVHIIKQDLVSPSAATAHIRIGNPRKGKSAQETNTILYLQVPLRPLDFLLSIST